MKVFAIIAEYNPLHSGHLHHIRETLQLADKLVVIMSGSFTQRGDVVIESKYRRAASAIRAGADMVIELPTLYAISPADKFAYGALKTLSAIDIDGLSFGSECGSVDKLNSAIEILDNETDEIKSIIREELDKGYPLVKAKANALEQLGLNACELTSNNTLGIEYLRAIKDLNLSIQPYSIERKGNSYNSYELSGIHLSATAIREAIYKGEYDTVEKYLPYPVKYNSRAPYNLGLSILFSLNSLTDEELLNIYDVSEGLNNRIKKCLIHSEYEHFIEALKTRRYTMARLKRILIASLLGISKKLYSKSLLASPYISVLAIKESSRDLLSLIKTKNIITKQSDISKLSDDVLPLLELDMLADRYQAIINKDYTRHKFMEVITD